MDIKKYPLLILIIFILFNLNYYYHKDFFYLIFLIILFLMITNLIHIHIYYLLKTLINVKYFILFITSGGEYTDYYMKIFYVLI